MPWLVATWKCKEQRFPRLMTRGRMLTKSPPGRSTAVVRPFSVDCASKGRSPKGPRCPQTTISVSQRIISRPPTPARRARNSIWRRKRRLPETKKLNRTLYQACFCRTVSKTRGPIELPCVAPSVITEHLHGFYLYSQFRFLLVFIAVCTNPQESSRH